MPLCKWVLLALISSRGASEGANEQWDGGQQGGGKG